MDESQKELNRNLLKRIRDLEKKIDKNSLLIEQLIRSVSHDEL